MTTKTLVIFFLLLFSPFFETTILSSFYGDWWPLVFFPLIVSIGYFILPTWKTVVISISMATWRDLYLSTYFMPTIVATLIIFSIFSLLSYLLANRTPLSDSLNVGLGYLGYLVGLYLSSALALRLTRHSILYPISASVVIGGFISILSIFFLIRRFTVNKSNLRITLR